MRFLYAKINLKGSILDTKISQKSGILIQDFLQKGGMHQVNIADFGYCRNSRLAVKNLEE